MARNDWFFNGRLPQNTVFSFASASFKFNYHQEQADNGGITIIIIIIITRDEQGGDDVQWPHGDIFCSLFSYSLLYIKRERVHIYTHTHVDWQDNGPGSCGGAEGA